MESIFYRRALATDAAALAQLHCDTVAGSYGHSYGAATLRAWCAGHTPAAWQRRLGSDTVFILAQADEAVLGCAGLTGNRTGIYVHPHAQRRGIARALFAALENLARARGIDVLELSAPTDAVPFYRAMGFAAVETKPLRFNNGSVITVVDMRRVLG